MNDGHLSAFEQEEYVMGERTPEVLHHLAHCGGCQSAVQRLDHGVSVFRTAAVKWSDDCLSTRPQRLPSHPRRMPIVVLRWAMAGALPILLLVLGLLAFHSPNQSSIRPAASISDDALLEQVDEQLSVAVPSSMESLTHLVSTENNQKAGAATTVRGSKQLVQTN